jgi:hypothetical protein
MAPHAARGTPPVWMSAFETAWPRTSDRWCDASSDQGALPVPDDRHRTRPAACLRSVVWRLRRSGALPRPGTARMAPGPSQRDRLQHVRVWGTPLHTLRRPAVAVVTRRGALEGRAATGRPQARPAHGDAGDSVVCGVVVDLGPPRRGWNVSSATGWSLRDTRLSEQIRASDHN